MTPEERTLLDDLFNKLRQAEGQPRDPEVERHIRERIQAHPAAPYYMAQAVLVQQHALTAAQQRIEELERDVREAQQRAQSGVGGFLGGAFGLGRRDEPRPQPPAPAAGPWGAPAPQPMHRQGHPPQGHPQAGVRAAGPWGSMAGGAPYGQRPGGGFMSGALQTAAGVAGGVLAASAISSLLQGGSSPFATAADEAGASDAAAPATDALGGAEESYQTTELPPDEGDYGADDSFGGDDSDWG